MAQSARPDRSGQHLAQLAFRPTLLRTEGGSSSRPRFSLLTPDIDAAYNPRVARGSAFSPSPNVVKLRRRCSANSRTFELLITKEGVKRW
jgi:hypothetical protein